MKCLNCENHCCIGDYATFLTLNDAKRISEETGIPVDEFCFYAPICADKEGHEELMQSKDHTYFDFSQSGNILQLKANKDKSCFFLKDKKCAIYNTRPLICRIFPFWYKKVKNEINIIIDDDFFKGGKTVESLNSIFYGNNFKIVNLILSYEFINDYDIFKTFVQSLI